MIGGFRSDLSITHKADGNFGNVSAGVLFSKSCKFFHLFRFVVFLPSSCSVVVSYFLQTILKRLARVLCWQLVNTANAPLLSLRSNLFMRTGELTHPALSTNCKSDPLLWLVKRKWHLWQLSSAEPAWKWDSQRSWPEAFFSLGLGASISASRRKFPNKKDSIKESLWDQGTVVYVFLEMFLCFFQQFDRLANVSRAWFIGLFLDPLSILAPHDSNLTVYVCWLFCVLNMP